MLNWYINELFSLLKIHYVTQMMAIYHKHDKLFYSLIHTKMKMFIAFSPSKFLVLYEFFLLLYSLWLNTK